MLRMTMGVGDYVMIGNNIRVSYDKNNGSAKVSFGVDAPRNVKIVRSAVYEESLTKRATEGDAVAANRLQQIAEDAKEQRRIADSRKEKHQSRMELARMAKDADINT